jgi:hypothetical protein
MLVVIVFRPASNLIDWNRKSDNRWNTWPNSIVRRETERTDWIPDKCSQHQRVCRIETSRESLWDSIIQIPQHGHACCLQYKVNFSWCSLQCSLLSKTYDGKFWYAAIDDWNYCQN